MHLDFVIVLLVDTFVVFSLDYFVRDLAWGCARQKSQFIFVSVGSGHFRMVMFMCGEGRRYTGLVLALGTLGQ